MGACVDEDDEDEQAEGCGEGFGCWSFCFANSGDLDIFSREPDARVMKSCLPYLGE